MFVAMLVSTALLTLSGCKKSGNESPSDEKNIQELSDRAQEALESNDKTEAIIHIEKIVYNHPESSIAQSYKLKLAELYFDVENFESAYRSYRSFTKLYPSDARAQEASYRAILSKYRQTMSFKSECDVTTAEKTVRLCDKYLNDPTYTDYLDDVSSIRATSMHRVIQKEIFVFNSYLTYGKTKSARKRLNYLKENYLPEYPEIAAQLDYLECKLAKAEERRDIQETCLARLNEKHPDSHYTRMARSIVNRSFFA
jgi:outer membrane assembly lipoprotein YfiO